ncbi:SDR family NAD(P)-dependent oxidoreductase [Aquimarina sp. BL5]|nr:SDR family NAD(P)-dependent oxidoreductase [Aquimarina sp. BL5]AXT49697.1 SDR family NAD(P)-dependent oxidoreductase [Aquimarina sp. BL5]RKM96806.1 SDR family NAD(P)-dependent oxidoreductase [Aquimarina sp. BL5]
MNKTILITGSTDGIGKLTAVKLAKDGHTIYVHGRNKEKLQGVILEIKEVSGNNNVDGFVADFSDLEDVKRMVTNIRNKVSKIDVLINNAGIFKTSATSKFENFDIRLVVNYFAPYVLTNAILPLLKNSESSRIINLSSAAQSHVTDTMLAGVGNVNANEAYAQSKLALTMWSFAFAKENPSITTIAVNPGSLLNTNMANEAYGQHWSPASKGSDILYDLAISEDYKDSTGKYFDNDKGNPKGNFAKAHQDAYDDELITKLVTKTEEIVG